ncbi:MAG: PD-(D/E)XK nuclease family protein [Lentisphaeria bacterium]|nr:PD-(D/E)XK nuclease family protein [Lentisphaeria bacterium]
MKKQVFLGFEGALPFLAAKKLLEEEKAVSGQDYSSTLLILPGSFAVREFYRHLAQNVPEGLFPPEVMTQGRFLEKDRDLTKAATEEESAIIRARVLASCDHRKYPALFTGDKRPSFSECFYLGRMLGNFLKELSLGGITLEDAIARTPAIDAERRKEIRELEKLCNDRLASYGLIDRFSLLHFTMPQTKEEVFANSGNGFAGIRKIIVCGVPGLLPAVQARLENFADSGEVEIWIQAHSSMEEYFDEWGNPVPEKWENIAFEQGKDEETFFHTEKASDLAKLAVAVAGRKGYMENNHCAIACADASLMSGFREELQKFGGKNIQIYDPAGTFFGKTRVGKLLRLLTGFLREGGMESFRALIRHEDFLLYSSSVSSVKGNDLLAALDTLMLDHLPDDLPSATAFANENMKRVLEKAIQIREKLTAKGVLAENLAEVLTEIYSIAFDRKDTQNISFEAQAVHLENFLKKCVSSSILKDLSPEEFYSLLENMMQSDVLYGELSRDRVEIHGFLELPNLEAPELLICGMSEGLVPERIEPNPFINDSQRLALGLPGNAHRAARDAFYLYESIVRRRNKGGKVRFFASKFSADGTPVRFSQFLFRGKMESMLSKAGLLFSAPVPMPERKREEISSDNNFYFRIPVEKYLNKLENIRISVTSFATYLESPLYFFLKHIMHMDVEDYSSRELDDLAFGNACHHVFESLPPGGYKEIYPLQEKMKEILEKYLYRNYGEKLPFLVDLQKDLILQRLYAAAPVLLQNEKEYSLLCQEYTLGGREEEGGEGVIHFAGLDIAGRIDRIAVSRDKKILQVLDFKTSNKALKPEDAHCKGKAEKEFISLQLPLYAILLRKDPFFTKKYPFLDLENMQIKCGYFNLPKAVTSTDIIIWEDMDTILGQAEEKVWQIAGELNEMKEKLFRGDPDKKIKYDDYADLFRKMPSSVLRGVKFPDVMFDPEFRDLCTFSKEMEKKKEKNPAVPGKNEGGEKE